ncbi:protein swallow isoform X1 [Drosophila persimilis]|uniref:protein swallow isoform X1 n=2 Tax=Drosophila persimilis TaxID=7234 RepID=UPI000F09A3E8|nr:protein swallow isoform X1 [Drosophila persimilis]XP_026844662.1 protein swallow isoform X1 [Drosophila persimilis]
MNLPRNFHSAKTIERFKHVPSKVALGIAEMQAMDQLRRSMKIKVDAHNSTNLPRKGARESGDNTCAGPDQDEALEDQQHRCAINKICQHSSMLEFMTPRERGHDFWLGEVHSLDESLAGSYERLLVENDRLLNENLGLRNDKVRLVADKMSAHEYINYLQAKLRENTIAIIQIKRSLATLRQKMDTSKRHANDTPKPAKVSKATQL